MVSVLHTLFCLIVSKYEDRTGDLWDMKGGLPLDGLPTLVKLLSLQFVCNAALQGTSLEEFEAQVTALSFVHLRDIDTSAHKVSQEEDADSRVVRS